MWGWKEQAWAGAAAGGGAPHPPGRESGSHKGCLVPCPQLVGVGWGALPAHKTAAPWQEPTSPGRGNRLLLAQLRPQLW